MNKVLMIGNITHDLELKTTNSGINYCSFNIAVSRKFKDQDGNRAADFFTVTTWRQQAEHCAKYLSKGKKVAVVGELQTDQRDAGPNKDVKVTYYKINADEVEFLSPADKGGQPTQEPADPNQGMIPVSDDKLPF